MKLNYNGPEKYEDKRYEEKKYDCYKCEDKHEDRKYEQKCEYHQPCCEERKYAKCYPMSPCPYGILFECAQGTMAKIGNTRIQNGTTAYFVPKSLGCVTIDTSCLQMPTIKFDFTCIIQYVNVDGTDPVRLTFELFKVCDNNSYEIPCGSWEYRANFTGTREELTTSFSFSHCECNSCPGCCTYYVKITQAQNLENTDILDVMAPTLSVMAKSTC